MGILSFFEAHAKSAVANYFYKLLALIAMMPLGGAALVYYQAYNVLPHLPSPEPRIVTCDELILSGASDHTYLVVTDFRFDTAQMCTNLTGSKDKWREAFIPIQSSAASAPERSVQVILYTEEALTPADLEELIAENELHGAAVRGTNAFTITQAIRLAGRFKGVNTQDCLFIRHEVLPPTHLSTYALIVLGVLMMIAGIPIWGFLYWLQKPERPVVAEVIE